MEYQIRFLSTKTIIYLAIIPYFDDEIMDSSYIVKFKFRTHIGKNQTLGTINNSNNVESEVNIKKFIYRDKYGNIKSLEVCNNRTKSEVY